MRELIETANKCRKLCDKVDSIVKKLGGERLSSGLIVVDSFDDAIEVGWIPTINRVIVDERGRILRRGDRR